MKNKILFIAVFASCMVTSTAQPFQKSYTTGSFQNQTSTKCFDAQPTMNGYTAFAELPTEKHLVLTDVNGMLQSALKMNLDQNNILGQGNTFAELSNGNYFLGGIINGNLVLTSFMPNGASISYDTYHLSSNTNYHDDVMQIFQVERYTDELVYIRGLAKSTFTGSSEPIPDPPHFYQFLTLAKRIGQTGNYSYTLQWIRPLGSGPIDINHPLVNTDGRFGDMYVSSVNGNIYYVGKSVTNDYGIPNPYWEIQKFNLTGANLFSRMFHTYNSYFEPAGVVENTSKTEVYVCGFNNTKSFIARLNATTGAHIWVRDYIPPAGYTNYKFRAIEYSALAGDTYRLKLVGEARNNTKYAISTQVHPTSGLPLGITAYYDYSGINEIAKQGNTNYILSANKVANFLEQSIYGIGLIKTYTTLTTDCSANITGPTYAVSPVFSSTYSVYSEISSEEIVTMEDGAQPENYSENTACCKLSVTNQTIYLCQNESANLDPGFYSSYTWNTGAKTRTIDVIEPGLYSVTAYNSEGCWGIIYFTVIQAPPLGLSSNITLITCFGANDGNICFSSFANIVSAAIVYPGSGGTQNVSINSTNFCFYNLIGLTSNPGLAPGFYSITVYDQYGCSETFTTNLTQPSATGISYSSGFATGGNCNGTLNFMISGGVSPYTLIVNGPGGYYYNGTSMVTLTGLCPGCYSVYVVDANGCSASLDGCATVDSQGLRGISTDLITESVSPSKFSVFPNPASEKIKIVSDKGAKFTFYNTLGNLIKEISANSEDTLEVDVSEIKPGIYIIKSSNHSNSVRLIRN